MKRRLLALATRPIVSATAQPWVCRRCMAQGAVMPAATQDFIAPSAAPQQSQEIQPLGAFINTSTTAPTASKIASQRSAGVQNATIKRLLALRDASSSVDDETLRWSNILNSDLSHDIPSQYLMYVNEDILTKKEKLQRKQLYEWAMPGHVDGQGQPKENAREIKGVVISTGRMDRTVKVRIPGQRWESRIKKYYADHKDHLVHDPNNTLAEGDIVILHRLHVAKTVEHVIGSVAVAYGTPLDQRPPIPTPEERLALYKEQRFAKLYRRHLRNKIEMGDTEAAARLKELAPATQPLPSRARGQKLKAPPSQTAQMAADYIAKFQRRAMIKATSRD